MLRGRCKSAGGEKGQSKRNSESCQSHFIVQTLFMNILSGWKDSWAATRVSARRQLCYYNRLALLLSTWM